MNNKIYYDSSINRARPFIKWAGGKRQLLKELTASLPQFKDYHEPFIGGGALFFELYNKNLLKHANLYDYNEELITTYKVVKENPLALIEELQNTVYKNNKATFYRIRSEIPTDIVKRAARFIYLNHTSYNGLYRVNANGVFNVPFGNYKNPRFFEKDVIQADSKALQKAELYSGDFSAVLHHANPGDLVYFDPPYNPLSKTSSFTSYTSADFNSKDQERLANVVKSLDKRGCFVMLSNSSTELVRSLYEGYHFRTVYANRAINCKANGRGKIAELIITNWETNQPQKKLATEASVHLEELVPLKPHSGHM